MMQRDEFINTLSSASVLVMLGVKAFTVIVFVFMVLGAGLNYQQKIAGVEPIITPAVTPIVTTVPLTGLAFGSQEMATAIPILATLVPTQTQTATLAPTSTNTPTFTPVVTEIPTQTFTAIVLDTLPSLQPTATSKPITTPTTAVIITPETNFLTSLVSSPLSGIASSELSGIITQPFGLPTTGEDSGHHGVDFAFWNHGVFASIEGLPITSVFPGKVISAYQKIRTPYGYMVIVETPLSSLPKEVVDAIKIPEELQTTASPSNRLTCPAGFADWWSTDSKSLYVLYGHMGDIPSVTLGQTVKIGDVLGLVGNTGSSSNPHLHLEMRIGPSNATFASMGHYDSTTTDQERHNYCMWRISGQFKMFDPMELYGGASTSSGTTGTYTPAQ